MNRRLVRALSYALLLPVSAFAQSRLEIGPLVALYAPVGSYEQVANYFYVGTPDHPYQNRATAYGGVARFWVTRNVGVQVEGMTSSVDHPSVFVPAGFSIASNTRVTSFDAQAVYRFATSIPDVQFRVSGGVGEIRHAGSSYTQFGSPTNLTGVVGVASRLALPYGFATELGLSSLLYNWAISDKNGEYQRGLQTDLLLHLGVTWRRP